jgi:hypothetical protein
VLVFGTEEMAMDYRRNNDPTDLRARTNIVPALQPAPAHNWELSIGKPGSTTARPAVRRRRLRKPTVLTGRKKRWIDPNKGVLKIFERQIDILASRYVYPHLSRFWNPYSWLLARRFCLAETSLHPHAWPDNLNRLQVLLISDIHTGIFLHREVVARIIADLIEVKPDLVAIAGDIVTGHSSEVAPFLSALSPLSRAPLGAWYCHGNHDYFGGRAEDIRSGLASVGIRTLKNQAIAIKHGDGEFVLGGIDDLVLGDPDWQQLCATAGRPHLLLAHNPDHFYEAASHEIPLTLSGHTHGGQIRFAYGPPLIRQSRYCLDEGAFSFRESLLVVSRGFGAVGLPWRWGAFPEAVLIEITPQK